LILETLQAVTFLGSFDIEDVIVNTLGAAMGYFAYRTGFRSYLMIRNVIITGVMLIVLTIGTMVFSEAVNKSITKVEGNAIALNQLPEKNRNVPEQESFTGFEVVHQKVIP
jgi:glycopeptide antibiotics resistance protein